jgi:hypothetical protein
MKKKPDFFYLTNFFLALFLLPILSSISYSKPAPVRILENELEKIFTEALQAVGNQKAIAEIKNIEAFAECLGPQGKYTTAIKSFRSDKTHFKQSFSYKKDNSNIFINDDLGWRESAESNNIEIVADFGRLVVNLHEYQKMAFDFQKMFSGFELVGEENFAGRPSTKVKAKNSLDGTIYLFFDKKTKLLAGYILPLPGSEETVKNVFNEWKKVGNVKLPSKITATDRSGDWVLNFNKIRINKTELNFSPRGRDLIELMRLHQQHQTAHLTYNAELFVETFAEKLINVQRGEVTIRTRDENRQRLKGYFSSYKFKEWKDIKPPVIKISGDGTLATVIVEKIVSGTYRNDKDETISDKTEFAWLEVWEKINGKWKVSTVASTRKR